MNQWLIAQCCSNSKSLSLIFIAILCPLALIFSTYAVSANIFSLQNILSAPTKVMIEGGCQRVPQNGLHYIYLYDLLHIWKVGKYLAHLFGTIVMLPTQIKFVMRVDGVEYF